MRKSVWRFDDLLDLFCVLSERRNKTGRDGRM